MAAFRPGNSSPPIISSSEDDASSDEEVTTAEIIVRLTKAWEAEKLAPELLVPFEDEINAIRGELVSMEGNLRTLEPTDMRLSIHRMEVKRLRYIIASYLRLRILKIQEYAWYYANQLQTHRGPRKSLPFMNDEILFLRDYVNNLDGFLLDVVLKNMPMHFQSFGKEIRLQLRKPPNLKRFVFFRSHMTCEINFLDGNNENETIEIEEGGQYIMPYISLRRYINHGEVTLL